MVKLFGTQTTFPKHVQQIPQSQFQGPIQLHALFITFPPDARFPRGNATVTEVGVEANL